MSFPRIRTKAPPSGETKGAQHASPPQTRRPADDLSLLIDWAEQGNLAALVKAFKTSEKVWRQHIDESGNGGTALMRAARHGRTEIVELLLKYGANPNVQSGSSGGCALHSAAFYGHAAVCEKLLLARADLTIANKSSTTALQMSAAEGHQDAMKLLLSYNGSVDLKGPKGESILAQAAAACKPIIEGVMSGKLNFSRGSPQPLAPSHAAHRSPARTLAPEFDASHADSSSLALPALSPHRGTVPTKSPATNARTRAGAPPTTAVSSALAPLPSLTSTAGRGGKPLSVDYGPDDSDSELELDLDAASPTSKPSASPKSTASNAPVARATAAPSTTSANKADHVAATRIQARFRGYRVRKHTPAPARKRAAPKGKLQTEKAAAPANSQGAPAPASAPATGTSSADQSASTAPEDTQTAAAPTSNAPSGAPLDTDTLGTLTNTPSAPQRQRRPSFVVASLPAPLLADVESADASSVSAALTTAADTDAGVDAAAPGQRFELVPAPETVLTALAEESPVPFAEQRQRRRSKYQEPAFASAAALASALDEDHRAAASKFSEPTPQPSAPSAQARARRPSFVIGSMPAPLLSVPSAPDGADGAEVASALASAPEDVLAPVADADHAEVVVAPASALEALSAVEPEQQGPRERRRSKYQEPDFIAQATRATAAAEAARDSADEGTRVRRRSKYQEPEFIAQVARAAQEAADNEAPRARRRSKYQEPEFAADAARASLAFSALPRPSESPTSRSARSNMLAVPEDEELPIIAPPTSAVDAPDAASATGNIRAAGARARRPSFVIASMPDPLVANAADGAGSDAAAAVAKALESAPEEVLHPTSDHVEVLEASPAVMETIHSLVAPDSAPASVAADAPVPTPSQSTSDAVPVEVEPAPLAPTGAAADQVNQVPAGSAAPQQRVRRRSKYQEPDFEAEAALATTAAALPTVSEDGASAPPAPSAPSVAVEQAPGATPGSAAAADIDTAFQPSEVSRVKRRSGAAQEPDFGLEQASAEKAGPIMVAAAVDGAPAAAVDPASTAVELAQTLDGPPALPVADASESLQQ